MCEVSGILFWLLLLSLHVLERFETLLTFSKSCLFSIESFLCLNSDTSLWYAKMYVWLVQQESAGHGISCSFDLISLHYSYWLLYQFSAIGGKISALELCKSLLKAFSVAWQSTVFFICMTIFNGTAFCFLPF